MRMLAFIVLFFISCNLQAQLYFSNNSFLYNKGNVVFVTGTIELNGTNSNLYLRNEGQLLQGTTGSSNNKGTGKLSVFQEGTVNNFAYNYWCSPVGTASTTLGNEDFGITMLNVPTTNVACSPATMITNDSDGQSSAGSLGISSYWIWKYLTGATFSNWFLSGINTNISAGQGFTMKGTAGTDATNVGETAVNNPGSGQRYDFRGKPNDGNITVNVGLNNYTLTGNPYPSALHVNAFLLDATNTACTGIAYYWEQNKTINSHYLTSYQGGYGTYSPISLGSSGVYVPATFNTYNSDGTLNTTGASSGLSIQRKYAPIGQGFMVKGASTGSITIKNSHRAYNKEGSFCQFEKSALPNQNSIMASNLGIETVSQIRLNTIINNQYTRQMALVFTPGATDGIDRGIDAKSPAEDNLPNDIYFLLNNDKYVIEGINFDIDKRIPIGIKSTDNCSFTFDASMIMNFDETQNIYIYDSFDGSYHDIKNDIYTVVLPTGIYNSRFQLTFKNSTLNVNHEIESSVFILQNNISQLLMISNPNLLELKSIKLIEINGKEIFEKQNFSNQQVYEFSTIGLSESLYLVEVLTKDEKKTVQKIIISPR